MRILMILDHYFPPDIRVENEIDSLIDAGFVIVLACYARENELEEEKRKGLTIIRLKSSSILRNKFSAACLTLPFYFRVWEKFILRILKIYKIDVLHIHDLPLSQIGVIVKQRFQKPFVLDLHENWPAAVSIYPHTNTFIGKIMSPASLWKKYEKRVVREAKKVILVTEEAKQRFQGRIGSNLFVVVSNCLRLESFKHVTSYSTYPKKKLILLYAGKINEHRGLQIVIDALQKVKTNKFELQIIGNGSYLSKLKKRVIEHGLQDSVTFFGWRSISEIANSLGKCDIALIPHLKSEHTDTTIPHKLFQYLYLNKFILASNCKPLQRIIAETDGGDTYQHDDETQLAIKLDDLYGNQEKLIVNSRFFVEGKYNWNQEAQKLLQVYKELNG